MTNEYFKALKDRHTYYYLGKSDDVSEAHIEEIIEQVMVNAPSSFNSQSERVLLLFGEQSDALWDLTLETLRKITPPEAFGATEKKIAGIKGGIGTILFFEDTSIVKGLQEKFPLYSESFPVWSIQSTAMLQFAIWLALDMEGLGASLHHYNPIIDDEVKARWNLPASWMHTGQMPFGTILVEPDPKVKAPVSERLTVYK